MHTLTLIVTLQSKSLKEIEKQRNLASKYLKSPMEEVIAFYPKIQSVDCTMKINGKFQWGHRVAKKSKQKKPAVSRRPQSKAKNTAKKARS
jgi:hypothetical protein